jgi:hypothetical protein
MIEEKASVEENVSERINLQNDSSTELQGNQAAQASTLPVTVACRSHCWSHVGVRNQLTRCVGCKMAVMPATLRKWCLEPAKRGRSKVCASQGLKAG